MRRPGGGNMRNTGGATGHRGRWTAALVVGLVLAVTACTGGSNSSSPNDTGGAVGANGYRATITRTPDGVPHIVADDLGSLAFGQGVASFQDRSCDLADQVVKIRSERSKWLGAGDNDANVDSDFTWKAIGIYDAAVAEYPSKDADVRTLIDGFAAGWDAELQNVGVDGINGWCRGAAWVQPVTGADVYAYARSVALQASSGALASYIPDAQPPGATGASSSGPVVATPATLPAGPASQPALATALAGSSAAVLADPGSLGSNGWAIGSDRTEAGDGMVLANPHFPWEQELRFWEVQLTIPGQMDIYGVQLSGLPGVGIGFTQHFAWTHTVSAGNRFTAYTLNLVPGKPTSYYYDGAERDMTSTDFTVDVKQPDGTTQPQTRTMWRSQYGPMIDFPGVGWTDTMAITFRDANIDDNQFIDQYLAMDEAQNLDQFIDAHRQHQGVPLFNTIAASDDGRAWYADTSATPNLSPQAIANWESAKQTNPLVGAAAQQGAVVLDGSDSTNEWVDAPGARSPGLVPFDQMPMVERSDYVFNANDSFWLPNADHPLEGDYSPLEGLQRTARSPRTRENAMVLRDTSDASLAGPGGLFSLDDLATAALANHGSTAQLLRTDVVQRCQATPSVDVAALDDSDPDLTLPAATVDLTQACQVLDQWDGTYNLDSVGAALWRETMSQYDSSAFLSAGPLWSEPFDASRPVDTPAGLAAAPAGQPDPVLVALGRAVQTLQKAGYSVDAALGDLQFADRNGTRVPIHGGQSVDGVTNIVTWSNHPGSTLEPIPKRGTTMTKKSSLTKDGYQIDYGSSFMMAVELRPADQGGPEARVLLSYGDTQDRSDPRFVESTQEFSQKQWRTVHLGEVSADDPGVTQQVVTG